MTSSLRMTSLYPALAALLLLPVFVAPSGAQLLPAHLDGLSPREIGPANMSGRLVDIAVVEMDTRVYYLASATGGVWKTTDNGLRFSPVFKDEAVHSVGDVVVHQQDTSVVWVGTGERANRQSSSWGDGYVDFHATAKTESQMLAVRPLKYLGTQKQCSRSLQNILR